MMPDAPNYWDLVEENRELRGLLAQARHALDQTHCKLQRYVHFAAMNQMQAVVQHFVSFDGDLTGVCYCGQHVADCREAVNHVLYSHYEESRDKLQALLREVEQQSDLPCDHIADLLDDGE